MFRDDKNTAIFIAFEEHEQRDQVLPERNLLRAILLNAMADLRKPGEPQRKATEYFLSGEQDYIFCFQSVCHYLNIDPNRVLLVTGLKRSRVAPHLNADETEMRGAVPRVAR